MEKFENLTMDQLESESSKATNEGYSNTVSVENVPADSVSANVVINSHLDKGITIKSPAFALICKSSAKCLPVNI